MPILPGSVSDLIHQYPWLILYSAVTTVGAVQKWGAALMKFITNALDGLLDLQTRFCRFNVAWHKNWWKSQAKLVAMRHHYAKPVNDPALEKSPTRNDQVDSYGRSTGAAESSTSRELLQSASRE
jgi:hypothetical protein